MEFQIFKEFRVEFYHLHFFELKSLRKVIQRIFCNNFTRGLFWNDLIFSELNDILAFIEVTLNLNWEI